MCSAIETALILAALVTSAGAGALPLRICADPNNLPYSNEQQQGFENKIAEMIGRDLHTQVTYTWYPQRGKFFIKTLNSNVCDVVMGVPVGLEEVAATQPYYRSTYVFISRADRHLEIHSFDDPRLRSLKIGVHVLGDQDDAEPPVHALISRGVVKNLVGFSIFGNLTEVNPAADLIRAVQNNDVDVAVAWGPLAGYFSKNSPVPLDVTPINDDPRNPALPFHYDIGIGVRARDTGLKQMLEDELERRHIEIERILRDYGIPQMPLQSAAQTPAIANSGRQE